MLSDIRDHYRIHHSDCHGKKRLNQKRTNEIEQVLVVKEESGLLHVANLGQSYGFVYTQFLTAVTIHPAIPGLPKSFLSLA